ncbi:hypothetical protein PMAYCL1PPCAC_08198, partial [Pristionchus mayeri]
MELFLPLEKQELIIACQRISFVFTSVLNVLSLYCILTKTAANQSGVRAYLLFIQILIVLTSVHNDVLFCSIPAFPAIAGFCLGWLCMIGLPPHSLEGVFIFLMALTCVAIMSCTLYRHQSIIPDTNPLRVSKSPYNISWIAGCGPFYIHRRTTGLLFAIYMSKTYLFIFTAVVLLLFWHMLFVLKNATNQSPSSVNIVRQSLIVLFIQIEVPLIMMMTPGCLLMTSIACECIPCKVTLPAYAALVLHPLSHNIILLTATPGYRRFIFRTL